MYQNKYLKIILFKAFLKKTTTANMTIFKLKVISQEKSIQRLTLQHILVHITNIKE